MKKQKLFILPLLYSEDYLLFIVVVVVAHPRLVMLKLVAKQINFRYYFIICLQQCTNELCFGIWRKFGKYHHIHHFISFSIQIFWNQTFYVIHFIWWFFFLQKFETFYGINKFYWNDCSACVCIHNIQYPKMNLMDVMSVNGWFLMRFSFSSSSFTTYKGMCVCAFCMLVYSDWIRLKCERFEGVCVCN